MIGQVAICETCHNHVYFTIRGKCEECYRNSIISEVKQQMNKGEILVAIHNMRGEYAHEQSAALMRIGKTALEGSQDLKRNESLALAYYQAQAKVSVLDELLEKIANTPDDTGDNRMKGE